MKRNPQIDPLLAEIIAAVSPHVPPIVRSVCPQCKGEGILGQNGSRWFCTQCAGRGTVLVETEWKDK